MNEASATGEHSPTPWQLDGDAETIAIEDANGEVLCIFQIEGTHCKDGDPEHGDFAPDREHEAKCERDAAFILRCVNAHDALVMACKAALKDSTAIPGKVYYGPGLELKLDTLEMIRDALKLAETQP